MYLEGGAKWHFQMMLLKERGEEQGESASAEGERMNTPMFDATRSWYGQIGAERVEANGKLTI